MKTKILFLLACGLFAGCAAPPKKMTAVQIPPVPRLASLNLYWDGSDNYTAAGGQAKGDYHFVRVEGFIFARLQAGTIPLKQYWSARRHDHWLLSGKIPKTVEKNGGYKFVSVEGYVYAHPQPGTVPLKLYSHVRGDNFTTATAQGEKDATNAGYSFRRVLGYVIPFPDAEMGNAFDANIKDGGLVLKTGERYQTPESFRPPVEIKIIAKTDSTNLRIGYAADQVIFNWELNKNQLRVDGGPANGMHKAGAGEIPAGKFVAIRWLVTPTEQQIYVDDQLRFQHAGDYSQIDKPVVVFPAEGSTVTVKSLTVEPLAAAAIGPVTNTGKSATPGQIQKWITQLQDADFSKRDAAIDALAQNPESALPVLERALKIETDDDRRWWLQSAIQRCREKHPQN
ncbi:MAG TPA: HEAT repeat domain-containing protein [Verrucomicrobiae bacterium]|nr:HEAT repeat domain-containing protein [Verrucomicrobiae bacterium]